MILQHGQIQAKGLDQYQIRNTHNLLIAEDPCPMRGVDAFAWGSPNNPTGFASDLRQVVDQPNSSLLWALMQEKIKLYAIRLPSWLFLSLFASSGHSDQPGYTYISSSSIERVAKVVTLGVLALIIWLSRFLFDDVGLIVFAL